MVSTPFTIPLSAFSRAASRLARPQPYRHTHMHTHTHMPAWRHTHTHMPEGTHTWWPTAA